MKRSMMQAYVKESDKAVKFYEKAFDAKLGANFPNKDGTFYHAELDVYGQIFAVAEANKNAESVTGNTMQFCLHFEKNEEDKVRKAYEILKDGAKINYALAPCDFSPLMADLTDKYGVRWCIFID